MKTPLFTVEQLVRLVARRHGVTLEEIGHKGGRVPKGVGCARRDAIFTISQHYPHFSPQQIARYLGGIHRTTVLYYLHRKAESAFDPSIPDESGVWAI